MMEIKTLHKNEDAISLYCMYESLNYLLSLDTWAIYAAL